MICPFRKLLGSFFSGLMLLPGSALAQEAVNAGPYVPSPQSVVADMLKLADVKASDFVIDLGSGDGRIGFKLGLGGRQYAFSATVKGDAIDGMADLALVLIDSNIYVTI